MPLLTPVDQAGAAEIMRRYGLQLTELIALPHAGTINSNFRVEASGHSFFLRINEGKRPEDVRAEAALVHMLAQRGVPTPAPLVLDKLVFYRDKPVTLFPWIEGELAEARVPSVPMAKVVGEALSRIHRASEAMGPVPLPENLYSLAALRERLLSFESHPELVQVAAELTEEINRASERRATRLPSGLIHQDLFPDNVLTNERDELVAVLDFEQATVGPYLYDLAVAINAWCFDGEQFVEELVVQAVDSYGPLGVREHRALGGEVRLAAARFAITRITDIFLRDVPEELRRRKDYRDYLRRLEAARQFDF